MAMPCTLTGGPPSKVSAIGKDCPLDNDQLSWAKPRLQLGAPSIMTRKIMQLWRGTRFRWTCLAEASAQAAGGEGGIRTPDRLAPMPHFECGAFNHSATSPGAKQERFTPRGRGVF